MQYRRLPNLDIELSTLGFGCMRLPVQEENQKKIDWERAKQMVRSAIDQGVNFIDTAWGYHGEQSEPFLADALSEGYREQVYLSTKLPSWMITSRQDMDQYLDEQLKRLNTSSIDFYMLHALDASRWETYCAHDVFSFLHEIKETGKVKHVGFSFHDDIKTFKTIVDAYPWDFCLIQYNFLDIFVQAGTEGLAYAYDKGLGIFVMEPLRGGNLVDNIPSQVQTLWNSAPVKRTPAEWAFRWVWNDPRISVVLSGMSSEEQVAENIAVAETVHPNSLTSEELQIISMVREEYHAKIQVGCTGCNYCMPCPQGVDIPRALSIMNNAFMFDDFAEGRRRYNLFLENHFASLCTKCGACEPLCPQSVPIMQSLKKVVDLFES